MTDRCEVSGCRGEVALIYLDRGVCDECWKRFTAEDAPPDALRMVLRIGTEAPTAKETEMTETKTETKPAKKTKAARAAKPKKAAAAKAAKPKKERPPKEDLVVFAFRLTQAERDAIHKTAGPRNATQFVRRVAVAFSGEDDAAFRTVIKEARELRQ